MKKSIILMCIGGMLALCTPLSASESTIDPPQTRQLTLKKKQVESRPETPAAEQDKTAAIKESEDNSGSKAEHPGVIVISGTALLLIIIILILLL